MRDQLGQLKKLRDLTEALPSFPVAVKKGKGFKIHEMEQGTSMSWDLWTEEGVSCARWFNSNGSVFPIHVHRQREWLIIVSGSMHFRLENEEERRLMPGQFVVVEPGQRHRARFTEDCWFLAITIPRNKDWPSSE